MNQSDKALPPVNKDFKGLMMKMSAPRTICCLAIALLSTNMGYAKSVYVIANNANTITNTNIRDIFLGEKQVAGDIKVTPLDNANLQTDFLEKFMKLDASKYASMWAKRGFRDGLNPPAVKNSDAEVLAAVKASPGGIGYVASAPTGGVRIVASFSEPVIDTKSCDAPKYPKGALLAEVVGTVYMEFVVDVDGKLLDSKVAKSSGNASLDSTALSAFILCKFKPGMIDGKAEKSRLSFNHVWKLE